MPNVPTYPTRATMFPPELPLQFEAELVGLRRAEVLRHNRARQCVGIHPGRDARRSVLQQRERVETGAGRVIDATYGKELTMLRAMLRNA